MLKQILLGLVIVATLTTFIVVATTSVIDGGVAFLLGILMCTAVFSSIYLYKDIVGWNNFEKPEGFSLKRKKK